MASGRRNLVTQNPASRSDLRTHRNEKRGPFILLLKWMTLRVGEMEESLPEVWHKQRGFGEPVKIDVLRLATPPWS